MNAFIRKNTEELCKKLESMGYSYVDNGHGEWHIPMNKLDYLVTGIEMNYAGTGKDFHIIWALMAIGITHGAIVAKMKKSF